MVTTVVTARPKPLSSMTLSVSRNFLLSVTKKLSGRFSRLTWMRRHDVGPIVWTRVDSDMPASTSVTGVTEFVCESASDCTCVVSVDADDGVIA